MYVLLHKIDGKWTVVEMYVTLDEAESAYQEFTDKFYSASPYAVNLAEILMLCREI